MNNLLNIYKPKGLTSHDLVDKVRRKYPDKKVGHGGTLDPMAEGVLIVGIGKATKKLAEVSNLDKTYIAQIAIGIGSKTDDLDSEKDLEIANNIAEINQPLIEKALSNFRGKIEQRVPLYSATHYHGEKLYKRARKGEKIPYNQLPKKIVEIKKLKLLDFKKEGFQYKNKHFPTIKLKIDCGSGTYIRSIARDLGRSLNNKGVLVSLIRTKVGEYKIENSLKLKELP
jgi:tRNA pseudouridine55 synthase